MGDFNLSEELVKELKKRNLWEQEDDNDDTNDSSNENESENESTNNEGFSEMISHLLHSQTQVHVFHLGTKSYAEHKALQGYYEGIDELTDGLVESYQGKNGLMSNYKTFKMSSYKNKKQVMSYFTQLLNIIEEKRDSVEDSYIQNQIDTVQELIYSTMYKLKFLN
jgi:DNA-binding ferritin-like protein